MTEKQIANLKKMGITNEQIQVMLNLIIASDWTYTIYDAYLRMMELEFFVEG